MAERLFDPRLVSRGVFVPHDYDALLHDHAIVKQLTRARYERALVQYAALADVSVERIVYTVGDLHITGVMASPKAMRTGRHPILIYNRGGNGAFGILTLPQLLRYMVTFARKGYLVMGSNYRGNDGGDGRDEMCGADVADVLELLDIARTHPGFDGRNAYMMGGSRGGSMTYLAIRDGAKLNAAATIAAPSDFMQLGEESPGMRDVYAKRIPLYKKNPEIYCAERSAVCWPEKLRVPLLLLHGDADESVNVSHTTRLGALLDQTGLAHKTVIYANDDHYLTRNHGPVIAEIEGWFGRYRLSPSS